jgi:hypothetical protein
MTATYCVEGRWYYIQDATLVGGAVDPERTHTLWTGWIWVREKKYHTDTTVTLFGMAPRKSTTHPGHTGKSYNSDRNIALEMRRGLTVKTLKDGPPAYVIQEQTLV